MKCPTQINPTYQLDYDDHWDKEKFDALPTFISDKMKTSVEYKRMVNPNEDKFIDESGQPLDEIEEQSDLPF